VGETSGASVGGPIQALYRSMKKGKKYLRLNTKENNFFAENNQKQNTDALSRIQTGFKTGNITVNIA
jgi:hypothetical protein